MVVGVGFEVLESYLHGVKSHAVHAVNIALGDKSIRVNRLHHTHYCHTFYLATHHQQHFHRMFGKPTRAVDHRATAATVVYYGIGYIFPLVGNDKKLYGLTVGINHLVGHKCSEHEFDKAIHHIIDAVEDKHTREDNHAIGIEQHATYCHIGALIHHSGYDVGAARAAIVHKCQAQTEAAQQAAYYHIHQRIVGCHYGVRKQWLHYREYHTQSHCAKHRAQHKTLAHYLIGKCKRYGIEHKHRRTQRQTHAIIKQRSQSRITAYHHILRQYESTQSE